MNRRESAIWDRRKFLQLSAAGTAAVVLPTWNVLPIFADAETIREAKRNDAASGETHKLGTAIKFAREAQEALKSIRDYEASFSKKELVGRKLIASDMQIKFREQPFSVYLKYLSPHAGREAIYVAGKNRDRILAHAEGLAALVGTLKLKPDSKDAMEDNRYPITMLGLSNMVGTVIKQWEDEEKHDDAIVKFFPNAKLEKLECKAVETSYEKQVSHAKFHMTRLFVAKETGLPVRVEQYGFPTAGGQPPVVEEYTYSNIKTNISLNDFDFDPNNKAYGY